MIELENINKTYRTSHGVNHVLRDVSFCVNRRQKLGILSRNGGGKTTLCRIISGADRDFRGRVTRSMSVSWPIGLGGAVHGSLSGVENIRFISRVYGTDFQETYDSVADFCELGAYLREPVNTYSSGMKAKFSFGISLAVKFDCYLVDEAISVGDARFRKKCRDAVMGSETGLILISHSRRLIEEYCDSAVVLHEGRAYAFERLVDAIEFHEGLLI